MSAPNQDSAINEIMEISRADFLAIITELARLRLLEKAVRNFATADCAMRELLKSCDA
jgi:hypothetical protein